MTRFALALVLVLGCGKSNEEALREQVEKDQKRNAAAAEVKKESSTEDKKEAPTPTEKPKEVAPPEPEPTTPAEIDTARKKAMIEGRDKDVIKYCEAGKIDPDKSDAQALLGCALAACRVNDGDKARSWAKGLLKNKKDKPLYDQAIKTCVAVGVTL